MAGGNKFDATASMVGYLYQCRFALFKAIEATRDALQIHGGNGVTREFIVERLVREAIICPIPDGTTEIQKLVVAKAKELGVTINPRYGKWNAETADIQAADAASSAVTPSGN